MPSWFKKVFTGGADRLESPEPTPTDASPAPTPVPTPTLEQPALGQPDMWSYEDDDPKLRKVVNAPVLMPDEECSSWSDEIRIKAKVEKDGTTCVFMVDRPVFEGLSAWFPNASWAENASPFAERIFSVDGVGNVLLHDMTVTVGTEERCKREWEDIAKEVGSVVREHLKTNSPVVAEEFVKGIPPEEDIRQRVQACIDLEINPGIAAHSGVVCLERVKGNTVYITMGGGCQGCAASTITLRHGIHTAFRRAVPEIGAIFDETDHATGTNPYYKELPAGMA